MTRIEEIEEERESWKARQKRASDKEEETKYAQATSIIYGLDLALRILKQ